MPSVTVDLGERGYEVAVGNGILAETGPRCRELGLGSRAAVIADAALTDSWLPALSGSLRDAGFQVMEIPFPGRDPEKNLAAAERIFGKLIEARMDRGCWIAALGGGVAGDLAGFVAATFLRGVDFVQVPTTIVAQVDASIGGKTAVNHALGKNTIGAFHQPRLVLADTATLRTLPVSERVAGMSEVVKHAVIADPELFEFLERNVEKVVALEIDPEQLDWLIARNAGIKASVVSGDEKESGRRAILNYGHTVGHAIEAATGYRNYSHGEAVILGMAAAGQIAALLGTWPAAEQRRQDALLERLGVPTGISQVPAADIVERTHADKKRRDGRLRFVLGRRIGEVSLVEDIDEKVVTAGVEYIQKAYP